MEKDMTQPAEAARLPARRRLLGLGVLGGAALASGVLGARPASAGDLINFLDRPFDLDPIVINFAYEMEELQCQFFERAAMSGGYGQLSGREQGAISLIAMQDKEQFKQLDALRSRLDIKGGDAFERFNASDSRQPRRFSFGGAFRSRESLLNTAVEIKELAVASYHGAIDNLDKGNITLAAAIAGTDGRHLSVLRELAGMDPVPTSFEVPISPQDTGRKLSKYGFQGGGLR